MGIIKAVNLIFDYIRHDEEKDQDEINHALKGVNLDIEEGSFVAILGHNGSGKSTFAKLMNGLLLPTDGTVYISDMRTSDEEHLWDVRRTAGMVFQNPDNQIIGNVVEEDVGFGPENMGVPTDEIWNRVDKSLEAVGMTAYRLQSPNKLSGGQKQRVAIARALASNPSILLCDEATSALDPQTTYSILELLKDINRKLGLTIVIITHQMSVVREICNRVAIMQAGRVVEEGSVAQIFAHPQSDVGRELVSKDSPSEGDTRTLTQDRIQSGNRIRIVFSENSSFEPVIANLILTFKEPVNIMKANTKNVGGTAKGDMLLEFMPGSTQQEAMKDYLRQRGLELEEVSDHE